jgi:hypothetical protein
VEFDVENDLFPLPVLSAQERVFMKRKKEENMKNLLMVVTAALLVIPFAGGASAKEKAPATQQQPAVAKGKIIKATATVVGVDQKSRIVTLKGPEGNIFDIKAGDEVRNLAQVKAGDLVTLKYYQSIMIELVKGGKVPEGTQKKATMERAKPGEKPSGMIGGQVTVTAKITAVNKKDQTVSLKGPAGKTVVVKAKNPKNLEKVKAGDEVMITYTEAVAISVESAKK